MDTEQIVSLDPSKIQADANVRFGLLRSGIDSLKESIVAQGRINDPVEVEPLDKKGLYKLTTGFYRHQAATELNKDGAGLLLPAIVRKPADATARLKRQLSENVDRKNLSPMDQAVAIKQLLDAGVTKPEIRQIFRRPGGRKGLAMQPASNAWLNMTLSFLDLPKSVHEKIHDGRVGVAAAYELTKLPKEKHAAVIEKAEANRLAELEREEKADERLAKAEESAAAKALKAAEASKKIDEAKAEEAKEAEAKTAALAALEAARVKVKEIAATPGYMAMKPEEKKAIAESLGAAKAEERAAEKAYSAATKTLDKAMHKVKGIEQSLQAKADAITPPSGAPDAKAPAKATKGEKGKGKGKGDAIGPREVKKAAAEVGASSKPQPLTAQEMRAAVANLSASGFKLTKAVGNLVLDCFSGKLAAMEMKTAVEVLLGERKTKKA